MAALPFINVLNNKLLTEGIESFSTTELNDFIIQIARAKNLPMMDVTMDYLFQYHKDLKIQKLNEECEKSILEGFVSDTTGHTYRTNIDDQLNFIGKYLVVKEDESILEVFWKPEDIGEQVPHTRDEFLSVYREAFDHKENSLRKIHILRIQVREAVTDADLLLIKW
jgi:hypothetical protein